MTGFQFFGGLTDLLNHGAPRRSQFVRSSAEERVASSYPNSVPQDGQISNDALPARSRGGS